MLATVVAVCMLLSGFGQNKLLAVAVAVAVFKRKHINIVTLRESKL